MKLIYNVKDRPPFGKTLVFALQQLLAIMAATIAVPSIVGNGMSQTAALFGAGVGTLVYLLFTKFRSPVFLGSSFAFIPSMTAAFAGAVGATTLGYLGLLIGAIFAGLVYVILALVVKFAGTKWINKVMPAVVIGPTVAIIGLSLAHEAVKQTVSYSAYDYGGLNAFAMTANSWVSLVCALVTLFVIVICSVFGKKMLKMIPFIIGILAGYVVAAIFTAIGKAADVAALQIIDFSKFGDMSWIPDFTFLKAFTAFNELKGSYIATIAVAYIPVAFVVFAEHLADHKNLSSIIEHDLTEDPGLHRTLLGDGIGSMAGALFGGCPNTTYGESIGCVAISGNASVVTIFVTAIMAIVVSFFGPFSAFLSTIPSCVMGGACITLYGFIAVSGLKMIQKTDLGDNRNLFTVSTILIVGVGTLALSFKVSDGIIKISSIACALILGIIVNAVLSLKKGTEEETEAADTTEAEETPAEKTEE